MRFLYIFFSTREGSLLSPCCIFTLFILHFERYKLETSYAAFQTLKVFIKNKTECSKKTEILYSVLEDKVRKLSPFLISKEEDKEMEKEVIILISSLLFSGANTYELYLMLKEKHVWKSLCNGVASPLRKCMFD